MKRRWLETIMVVTMLGIFASCTASAEEEKEVLYAAVQSDYPPFCYYNADNELTGYDVEVLQAISDKLEDYTIEIQPLAWDAMFLALDSDTIQMISDQVAITPEREELYNFSDPYFTSESVIIVKKGRDDISTLEDLEGKKVWALIGDSYTQILENYNEEHDNAISLSYVSDQAMVDAFYDLVTGKLDAVVNDPVMAQSIINEKDMDVEIVGEPVKSDDMGIVFAKSEKGEKLQAAVNEALAELKEDGTLDELSEKWTGSVYVPE
jgi:L-cystine transport system substrate-binding protein